MLNFSMLLINNNRSKAYLQTLLKNGFKPEKIILLNDKNVELPEHTENDKLISKDEDKDGGFFKKWFKQEAFNKNTAIGSVVQTV